MTSKPITDTEIEAAIQKHDDPEHPDAATVDEVRDILAAIQASVEEYWSEHMDVIEDGGVEVIHEDGDTLVLADHTGHGLSEELDAAGVDDDVTRTVVSSVYHTAANRLADYNWSASTPLVVSKPAGVEDGQQFVEAIVNSLLRKGLSPGQAWAYYGVEIRGHSRNSWSQRCGYSDHSAVSEPLRKAQEKLP